MYVLVSTWEGRQGAKRHRKGLLEKKNFSLHIQCVHDTVGTGWTRDNRLVTRDTGTGFLILGLDGKLHPTTG